MQLWGWEVNRWWEKGRREAGYPSVGGGGVQEPGEIGKIFCNRKSHTVGTIVKGVAAGCYFPF